MVRILSGTLLEVGFGKREADSMQELLEAKNRSLAGAFYALLRVDQILDTQEIVACLKTLYQKQLPFSLRI